MEAHRVNIKVVGIGGAGGNIVDALGREYPGMAGYAAVNTDAMALGRLGVAETLAIGHSVTKGLSAGNDPKVGFRAAKVDSERIEAMVEGVDLLFLVVGLGGGTGSGATHHVAKLARKAGALVVAFAALPFTIEGKIRGEQAAQAMGQLRIEANALIPLPNDLLLQTHGAEESVIDAFNEGNAWIGRCIRSIVECLEKPGILNLDFAALRGAFESGGGKTLFGFSEGRGEGYIEKALENLSLCPLLHMAQTSARADVLLVNLKGGRNLSLREVTEVAAKLGAQYQSADNTVIGAIIDDSQEDFLEITVLGMADLYRTSGGAGARKRGKRKEDPKQQVLFDEFDRVSPSAKKSVRKKVGGTSQGASNRGYFYETERTIFGGEDLDVPTYLRRGLKVSL